jgi:hypothetical protein
VIYLWFVTFVLVSKTKTHLTCILGQPILISVRSMFAVTVNKVFKTISVNVMNMHFHICLSNKVS